MLQASVCDEQLMSIGGEIALSGHIKCCECMIWDDTYTHVFCARRRAAGLVSHMFTHALTVCTQGMILSD